MLLGQNIRIKPTEQLWLMAYNEWMKSGFHYRKAFRELGHVRSRLKGPPYVVLHVPCCSVCFHQLTSQHSEVRDAFLWFYIPVGLHSHLLHTALLWQCVPARGNYFLTFSLKTNIIINSSKLYQKLFQTGDADLGEKGLKAFIGCTQNVPRKICET
jgi:hypothetical protein